MPKQKRWTIKRQLDLADNNINRAIDNVVLAGHEFEDVHPDYYQAFSMIATNLVKIRDTIAEFKDLV